MTMVDCRFCKQLAADGLVAMQMTDDDGLLAMTDAVWLELDNRFNIYRERPMMNVCLSQASAVSLKQWGVAHYRSSDAECPTSDVEDLQFWDSAHT